MAWLAELGEGELGLALVAWHQSPTPHPSFCNASLLRKLVEIPTAPQRPFEGSQDCEHAESRPECEQGEYEKKFLL